MGVRGTPGSEAQSAPRGPLLWRVMLRSRYVVVLAVLILSACGGGGESDQDTRPAGVEPTALTAEPVSPTYPPSSARSTPRGVERFFPVTVVVETDKAWMQVDTLTRSAGVEDHPTVVLEGSVQALSDGVFNYRLAFIDSEGTIYPDSPGVRLGTLEAGADVPFRTSIQVPLDAILVKLAYGIVGAERPTLSYVIDLAVADIPLASR